MVKIESGLFGETMFERLKRLYGNGQLTIDQVKNAVVKNMITESEYTKIIEKH